MTGFQVGDQVQGMVPVLGLVGGTVIEVRETALVIRSDWGWWGCPSRTRAIIRRQSARIAT